MMVPSGILNLFQELAANTTIQQHRLQEIFMLFSRPVFKTFTDAHITIHNEIHTLIKASGLDRHPPPFHQAQVVHVRNITIGSPA